MRDELMIEAFCFELQSLIRAETAHSLSNYHYFCAEENCLVQVHPQQKKNCYFVARSTHAVNCANAPPKKETSGPGDPKPRPTPKPPRLIPTLLGPAPHILPWVKPSPIHLREMIRVAKAKPALISGSLEDVVNAWTSLEKKERYENPLTIGDESLNYATVFYFLKRAGESVDSVPWHSRIVFGAANYWIGRNAQGYSSIKNFVEDSKRCPLRLSVANTESMPGMSLPTLNGTKGTLFMIGVTPIWIPKRECFGLDPSCHEKYTGFVFRDTVF